MRVSVPAKGGPNRCFTRSGYETTQSGRSRSGRVGEDREGWGGGGHRATFPSFASGEFSIHAKAKD